MIPLEIAIELDYTQTASYSLFTVTIDIIFFFDILVNFSTTLNVNSEEIKDRAEIARHYLRGSFTIDFLSAFPIDAMATLIIGELSAK